MKSVIVSLILIAVRFVSIPRAYGQTIPLSNPLGVSDIGAFLTTLGTKLMQFGAPVAGVMVLVGGFQMLFSGGDPEKFATGRKTILYAAIGYGIILVSGGVALLIESITTP